MRNLPIDTTGMDIVVAGDVEPATSPDGTTRVDRNGRALWNIPVVIFPKDGQGEGLVVRVPALTERLARMTPVVFDRLTATPWNMDGRSGISFRAEAVQVRAAGKPS